LHDAAARAGADVRDGVRVEELVYEAGAVAGVVARDDRGRRVYRARVVVGADGLHSVVARRLGPVRTWGPRRVALTAHVAGVAGVGELGELHIGTQGYVGLADVGGGLATIALVIPAARARGADFFGGLDAFAGVRGRARRSGLARPILATGPFTRWARRVVAAGGGALLVGDAADFFDPFTGQGIFAALRGAELAAATLLPALAQPGTAPLAAGALAGYATARRTAFLGKWTLERLIGLGVGWPAIATRVVRRLARRADLADLLVGAAGNFVPLRAALSPRAVAGFLV
jgi:flavin-dependent dehydrogenase